MDQPQLIDLLRNIEKRVYSELQIDLKAYPCIDLDKRVTGSDLLKSFDVYLVMSCVLKRLEFTEKNECPAKPSRRMEYLTALCNQSAAQDFTHKPESLCAEAMGVINYLNMYTLSGDIELLNRALVLIDITHRSLGYNDVQMSKQEPMRRNAKWAKKENSPPLMENGYLAHLCEASCPMAALDEQENNGSEAFPSTDGSSDDEASVSGVDTDGEEMSKTPESDWMGVCK